jgi:hypothetical protein
MARKSELEAVLKEFCDDIDATGGVLFNGLVYRPVGDEEWTDLAATYMRACELLGREPKVNGPGPDELYMETGEPA